MPRSVFILRASIHTGLRARLTVQMAGIALRPPGVRRSVKTWRMIVRSEISRAWPMRGLPQSLKLAGAGPKSEVESVSVGYSARMRERRHVGVRVIIERLCAQLDYVGGVCQLCDIS